MDAVLPRRLSQEERSEIEQLIAVEDAQVPDRGDLLGREIENGARCRDEPMRSGLLKLHHLARIAVAVQFAPPVALRHGRLGQEADRHRAERRPLPAPEPGRAELGGVDARAGPTLKNSGRREGRSSAADKSGAGQ